MRARTVEQALIEKLSAQTLTGAGWFGCAQVAATALFGPCAVALVRREDPGRASLVGLASASGALEVCPPDRLHVVGSGLGEIGLAQPAAPGWAALTARVWPVLAACPAVYAIPWPLGLPDRYEWLLVPPAGNQLDEPATACTAAFLQVAGNLLRRVESRTLAEAQGWIEDEIRKLVKLQHLLQPPPHERLAGVDYAVYSRPQRYAGGDYYDISLLERGGPSLCAVGLADVSGHGPAAVVETAMIDTILRTYRDAAAQATRPGPAAVADYLNRHMFTRRPRPSFATAFLAVWDAGASVLHYTCAGHPPPLVRCAADGTVAPLEVGNDIPLQVLRDYRYGQHTLALAAGDLVLLYTDGISEALSPRGEQFGVARLGAALAAAGAAPRQVIASITATLAAHAGGRAAHDDQTLIALRKL